jgi:crotonobetainyl-CoA:carnitine CoA-transferase CaiB-like acyl-CoA transferase
MNGEGESVTGPIPQRASSFPPLSPDQQPLSGLHVIDATQGYAGPYVGLLLAESGAEVIKIEPPDGDYARGFAPAGPDGASALFSAFNRNKRGLVLNLDDVDDRRTYQDLVRSADIVLEDWGPGVADTRQLGYNDLQHLRSDLVYCALSHFGERGPLRDQPGGEIVIQGMTEYWKNLGALGSPPLRVGSQIAGHGTAVLAFLGILAALYHRARTGEGQRLALSQLGAAMFLRTIQWAAVSNPDQWLDASYNDNQVGRPRYGYRTKDRSIYFNLNKSTEEQFLALLEELGMLDEVIEDPRFENGGRRAVGMGQYADDVRDIWDAHFQTLPYQKVMEILNRHGCMAAELLFLDEVLQHPQTRTLNMLTEDRAGRSYLRAPWQGPWKPIELRPAPTLDQDHDAVIAAVRTSQVTGT